MYEFIEFLKLLIWCWATMQTKYISITFICVFNITLIFNIQRFDSDLDKHMTVWKQPKTMAWYLLKTTALETYNKIEVRIMRQDCRLYFGFIV
jgi:hypothetical protein